MNKQELNNAFESFNPTEQQKQRMLDGIMSKKNNVFSWRKVYIPACSVAAAALIFAVTSGLLAPGDVTDNGNFVAVNTPDVVQELQKDETVSATDAKTEVAVEEEISFKKPSFTAAETKKSENSDNDSVKADLVEPVQEKQPTAKPVAEPEIIPGEVTAFALNINTASTALKSRAIDAPAVATVDTVESMVAYDGSDEQGAYSGGGGGAVSGGGSTAAGGDVTYQEFCAKVGSDIRCALRLPEGMTDITVLEKYTADGNADEWDISYVGADGCFVTVNICTDTQHNRQYFENESFEKTDINGTDAVIIYDGNSYTAYMDVNNISYTVTANISEQQLAELLVSMK